MTAPHTESAQVGWFRAAPTPDTLRRRPGNEDGLAVMSARGLKAIQTALGDVGVWLTIDRPLTTDYPAEMYQPPYQEGDMQLITANRQHATLPIGMVTIRNMVQHGYSALFDNRETCDAFCVDLATVAKYRNALMIRPQFSPDPDKLWVPESYRLPQRPNM
jgi:hypothetical protein